MLMTRLRRLLNGRLTVWQVNFQRAGGIQRVRAVIERLHHDLHGAGLPRREHIIRQIRRVQPQLRGIGPLQRDHPGRTGARRRCPYW